MAGLMAVPLLLRRLLISRSRASSQESEAGVGLFSVLGRRQLHVMVSSLLPE
jgi:hypothetical protein